MLQGGGGFMAAAHDEGGSAGSVTVRRQKFFKILLPGTPFASTLRLPPKFAASLDIPPGFAIATLRDPAGRSWHVDLDRRRPCFTGTGWRSFLVSTAVSAGHLLVFEHLGGLLFAVEPFDASGCSLDVLAHDRQHVAAPTACSRSVPDDDHGADVQSGYNNKNNNNSVAKKRKRSPATGSCGRRSSPEGDDEDDENLLLRCTIERPSHLQYLYLTKTLCDRMGWTASRTAQLSVVTGAGGERRWEVAVKVSAKGGMMVTGWAGFAQDNGLRVSDACVFRPPLLPADTTNNNQPVHVQLIRGCSSCQKSD